MEFVFFWRFHSGILRMDRDVNDLTAIIPLAVAGVSSQVENEIAIISYITKIQLK